MKKKTQKEIEKLKDFYAKNLPELKREQRVVKEARKRYLKCWNYTEVARSMEIPFDYVYKWCNPKRYKDIRSYYK